MNTLLTVSFAFFCLLVLSGEALFIVLGNFLHPSSTIFSFLFNVPSFPDENARFVVVFLRLNIRCVVNAALLLCQLLCPLDFAKYHLIEVEIYNPEFL